jgi:hypothetical protein
MALLLCQRHYFGRFHRQGAESDPPEKKLVGQRITFLDYVDGFWGSIEVATVDGHYFRSRVKHRGFVELLLLLLTQSTILVPA